MDPDTMVQKQVDSVSFMQGLGVAAEAQAPFAEGRDGLFSNEG